MNARDIPDFGVVRNQRQFVIRQEMPRAKQRLSKSALPEGTAFELSLRSISDIQAQADATNQDLLILIVDQPEMYGDNASVWLGTDIVLHHQSERKIMKTCCGIGRADFRRNGTTWVFVRWTGVAIA